MDPKTPASQKLGQLMCVASGTHILHALEKMNGEPIITDNGSNEPSDWIAVDVKNVIATCPETARFEYLMIFGTDLTIETRQTNIHFDSNSQNNMPAMT